MALEIERKFLVNPALLPEVLPLAERKAHIEQGYLHAAVPVVRVRIAQGEGLLTVKGPRVGLTCDEFEFRIPLEDARRMLDAHGASRLAKTRYVFKLEEPSGAVLELDVFEGELSGLVLAEVELQSETQQLCLPSWVGREVSHDPRYTNLELAKEGRPPAIAAG